MADNVKWIKLKVGMFDGESFKKIKRAKIGGESFRDKLTAIWFELMDFAGKCNHDGALIGSNEIPFDSYESIATMIDRENDELELCMKFYLREGMIEIIDNVYCLSNFLKYQNQEGLEKIREQKRIAQSKWRERTKLGLIVDKKISTHNLQDNLPSYSYSNSISNIFDYWNSKEIIKHKELKEDIVKSIEKCLKTYTEEQIKTYIDRYNMVIKDTNYFFDYKWTLKEFLSRKDGISSFTEEGSKWMSYVMQTGFSSKPNVKVKYEDGSDYE